MSNYFTFLPNVYVRNSSYRRDNVDPYVLAKNIFRRIKIRDNLDDVVLGFEQYTVPNNERPDQTAWKFYGNMAYDWVVLICNNIINVYDEWPMTEDELYKFASARYSNIDDIHHWETQEIKSPRGDVMLKSGMTVSETFTYNRPDGTPVLKEDLLFPVTNWEYEVRDNDYKRNIYLLRPQYLTEFVEEFLNLCEYLPNSEVDENGDKVTQGAVREVFKTVKDEYSTDIGNIPSVEFAATGEYTSRTFTRESLGIGEGQTLADGTTTVTTGAAGTASSTTQTAGTQTTTETNQYGSSSGQSSGTNLSQGYGGGY